MKKYMLVLSICLPNMLYSAIGCMDNSKYTNRSDGYDYKTYHHVGCACRCQRYAHSYERGMCTHCGHFRVPEQVAWLPVIPHQKRNN
jgi:hypothetical protein